MRPRRSTALVRRAALPAVALVVLASAPPVVAQSGPPPQQLVAVSTLPPGNSGFVSAAGQAQGTAGGDPGDYGAHLDDQRDLYWRFQHKLGAFHADGPAETPKAGVRIHRDAYGVPSVYGDTGRDVWWGAGYAAAQDRLFLMDAVRRTGQGTLAELTGSPAVPEDVRHRVLTYSSEEYAGFFDGLSQDAKDAIEGYVEGANAWRAKAVADPLLLPAEYALLTSLPEPFTVEGVLAGGVEITRVVASEGGNEMANVAALRELETALGVSAGRGVFQDLVWTEDAEAVTTVPPGEGSFSNQPTDPAQREAVFQQMADFAQTIPLSLGAGAGTGAFPEPPAPPGAQPSGSPETRAAVAKAASAVAEWARALHGGSFALAVAPERSSDGTAKLVSAPQLGYSYPSLLWELEVHGGGYDARGVSVPGLPTVGIGYGERTAWALTTGYSKTVDSFIETTRPGEGDAPPQYLHDGVWKDQECRTETVRYRAAPQGVPAGPPALSTDVEVCRTVHGPVVAVSADGLVSRSVGYAMYRHELDTIEGILRWNRVDDLAGFTDGVRQVTWNENVTYADADGHIAFFHPGRYPRRSPASDQRLPVPGTGAYDHDELLAFDELPHSVDPEQGYLANWNNKPALGWVEGEGIGPTSRPGGPVQRVSNLVALMGDRRDLTFQGMQDLERDAGTRDVRTDLLFPLLDGLGSGGGLTPGQQAALDLLLGWDRRHYDPTTDPDAATVDDGPAAALMDELVLALRRQLFTGLPETLLDRQSGVGSHVYDASPLDNVVRRVLDPGSSALVPSRDYTGGRPARTVLLAALDDALAQLAAEFSPDPASWQRPHPRSEVCSLTGVIGPCLTMPYVDRGSWIHVVSFTRAGVGPAPQPGPGTTPATGGEAWLGPLALLTLLAAAAAARSESLA